MINKIKNLVVGNYLSHKLKGVSREKKFINFQNARTVGLLFDASDPDVYDLVKKYIKYLKEAKKKVKAIGYFNTKTLPSVEYVTVDYDFFTKKDLTWYGKPTHNLVKNFIQEEYDILINFSLEGSFPLQYIAAMSKAKFKIGRAGDNDEVYDMLLEQPEDKDFKFFMRQVDHYLGIVNKIANSD